MPLPLPIPPDLLAQRFLTLAEAISGSWPRITAVWEEFRIRHGFRLRADVGENDQIDFLVEALSAAYGKGRLRQLVIALVENDLAGTGFDDAATQILGPLAFQLQAFQNNVFTPTNALLSGKRMLRACEHVCRIDIDGVQNGTGVLVRPTLVATAAHVVRALLDTDPEGSVTAKPDSIRHLKLIFGDAEDYLDDGSGGIGRKPGEVAFLNEDWLAYASPPTSLESSPATFNVNDITGIADPAGPWDLALIRLARPPRLGLKGHDLLPDEPPLPPYQIHVLHHPHGTQKMGQPLLWSIGKMNQNLGTPTVRCLHDANTAGGSSGAPIFNDEWRVIALHQAGKEITNTPGANRAVPVARWARQIDAIASERDDTPYVAVLEDRPGIAPFPHPVIGRRRTQKRVWTAMRPDATAEQRLFVIRGDEGRGKRFTKRLVRAMVAPRGDLVAVLDMVNAQEDDAAAFALRVAGAFGTELTQPLEPTRLTTAMRDIRNEIVPALASEIERMAGAKSLWLVLEGFDVANLSAAAGVPQLLDELIAQLDSVPKLRLVLVGWKATVDQRFEQAVEELEPPTAADAVGYMRLRLFPLGANPNAEPVHLATLVNGLMSLVDLNSAEAYGSIIELLAPLTAQLAQTLRTHAPQEAAQ